MNNSKTNMPSDKKKKCHVIIHVASAAALAAGTIPIPLADTIPISAAQVIMVVNLGKVFDFSISESVAKSIIGVGVAQQVGKSFVKELLKAIGKKTLGPAISGATAASLTELMGWMIADDFYRLSVGEEPQNMTENLKNLKDGIEWKS